MLLRLQPPRRLVTRLLHQGGAGAALVGRHQPQQRLTGNVTFNEEPASVFNDHGQLALLG